MSLDVYLTGDEREGECTCFDCGHKHTKTVADTLYECNITHNLGTMANEAGIYEHLWRPEEIGISKASQLIEPLDQGLELLRSDPKRFKRFDSPNGWGLYEHLVEFIAGYLRACREYPDANIRVSR
jgi:hypothetical protein